MSLSTSYFQLRRGAHAQDFLQENLGGEIDSDFSLAGVSRENVESVKYGVGRMWQLF